MSEKTFTITLTPKMAAYFEAFKATGEERYKQRQEMHVARTMLRTSVFTPDLNPATSRPMPTDDQIATRLFEIGVSMALHGSTGLRHPGALYRPPCNTTGLFDDEGADDVFGP